MKKVNSNFLIIIEIMCLFLFNLNYITIDITIPSAIYDIFSMILNNHNLISILFMTMSLRVLLCYINLKTANVISVWMTCILVLRKPGLSNNYLMLLIFYSIVYSPTYSK